jgi:hypothetical protein
MAARQVSEPLYRRVDLHVAWIGLPVTVVIGAGAWLGVPNVIIPMVLLLFAFAASITYVFVMIPVSTAKRVLFSIVVVAIFWVIGWAFWFVFAVDMKVKYLTGSKDPRGGEEVRFAVELTNKGKPTSLTHWRATLIDSNGNAYIGEPLQLTGDTVEIEDANSVKTLYALPECDLRYQTVKALQSGDSAYGVAAFLFRNYPAQSLPLDTKVTLAATDMLGRTISSGEIQLSTIAAQPRDIFPCREVKAP